jgi:hypothetical protein
LTGTAEQTGGQFKLKAGTTVKVSSPLAVLNIRDGSIEGTGKV